MTQQARRGNVGYRRDDADIHPPYLYPDYVSTRLRAPKKPLIILPKAFRITRAFGTTCSLSGWIMGQVRRPGQRPWPRTI